MISELFTRFSNRLISSIIMFFKTSNKASGGTPIKPSHDIKNCFRNSEFDSSVPSRHSNAGHYNRDERHIDAGSREKIQRLRDSSQLKKKAIGVLELLGIPSEKELPSTINKKPNNFLNQQSSLHQSQINSSRSKVVPEVAASRGKSVPPQPNEDQMFEMQVYVDDAKGNLSADITRFFNRIGYKMENPYSEYCKESENLSSALLLDNIVAYVNCISHYYKLSGGLVTIKKPDSRLREDWETALYWLKRRTDDSLIFRHARKLLDHAINHPTTPIDNQFAEEVLDLENTNSSSTFNLTPENQLQFLKLNKRIQEKSVENKRLVDRLKRSSPNHLGLSKRPLLNYRY